MDSRKSTRQNPLRQVDLDGPSVFGDFRKQRAEGVRMVAPDLESHGSIIEAAAMNMLRLLGEGT